MEARWGLGLFLRRGLWAWAQALAGTLAPESPERAAGSILSVPCPPKGIIQIFAALALNTPNRRSR